MMGALADLLVDALGSGSGAISEPSGGKLSGAALLGAAERAAAALRSAGARPCEPVLVTIDNRPADIAGLLGVWLAEAVAVPVPRDAPAAAVDALRQRTGARFTLATGTVQAAGGTPPRREPPEDAALVLFTSGTTGRRKGVVIGHQRLAGKLAVLRRLLDFQPDDEVVLPLRLTFIFGIWVALLSLWSGTTVALLPRFSRRAVVAELERGRAVLATVPTMLRLLLGERPRAAPRAILSGGEVLTPNLGATIRTVWPETRLFDLYGLSETGSCDFCLHPQDQPAGFGTIGRPTEGVAFRIVDGNGRPAGPGEPGELQIKSPFGMLGYLDDPALERASFADGYFRTGDLAGDTGDGRVRIVGRIKEIISRGGIKIAPAEVEVALEDHPAVEAALCGGVADPLRGEAVHVLVVIREGASFDAEALDRWLGSRLEPDKAPDAIHPVDRLPTGPTGKLDRRAVARIVAHGRNAGMSA